jgi:CCAAT/enhancer binding protein (C/EBP) gamma
MSPRKVISNNGKRNQGEKQDSNYKDKRNKNNDAVKKSREKTRVKAKETMERVNQLKQENEMLEERIKLLSKELTFLKDIFLAHAGSSHGMTLESMELTSILKEEDQDFDESEMEEESAQQSSG